MSRNYGSLGRRSGSSAWQWVVIGLVVGFACSATLFLGALAAGLVGVDGQGAAFGPTNTPFIITATPMPATETPQPTEVIITPTDEIVIEAPSPTPTIDPTQLTPLPTATPEATQPAVTNNPIGQPTAQSGVQTNVMSAQNTSDGPPDILTRLASPLLPVQAGQFNMGTTAAEAAIAVRDCVERDRGACQEAWAQDSFPQHLVTLSGFRIEQTEVTYEQYVAFLNWMGPNSHATGCEGQPCLATRSESETSSVTFDSANYAVPSVINRFPVIEVTWYGAKAYCETLGRRLPTEAEWEYAAKGLNGTVYPWGDTWDAANAWTSRSAPDDGEEGGPIAVDSFPLGRSWTGALNMAGNVAEWVSDWYGEGYYFEASAAGPDPVGPPLGDEKVVRGGSWPDVPFFARTVHRQSQRPGDPTAWIGFRCAADPEGAVSNTPASGIDTTLPIGAAPIVQPTQQGAVDPATLGTNVQPAGGNEGDLGSQPTLAPRPTRISPTALPGAGESTVPVATLEPS
jgi:serine/threonine-protein kinase